MFKFLIPALWLLATSCSINGNFRGLYSYYERTQAEQPGLIVKTDSGTDLCALQVSNPPKVYVTNGLELKKCLKSTHNALVFMWSIKCSGPSCYNLEALQRYCDNNNYELFIVAEYYDGKSMLEPRSIKHPVFGPDIDYYHSGLTETYISKFKQELTGQEKNEHLMLFRNGEFVKSVDLLTEL